MNKHLQFEKNYRTINCIVAKCMRITFVFVMIIMVFAIIGGFKFDQQAVIICFGLSGVLLLVPTLLVNVLELNHSSIKYVIVTCTVLVVGFICAFMSNIMIAIVLFPLLIASLYYNRSLVLYVTLANSLTILIAAILNVYVGLADKMRAESIHVALTEVASPTVVIIIGMSAIAFYIVDRNASMIEDTIEYSENLIKGQEELIYAFAEISENKSKNTGEHIRRVSDYMRILSLGSGFTVEYTEKLATASMMHDIGKIMIPEYIIDKPGKLTEEEYAIMKSHTLYGEALLMKAPGDIMQIARTIAAQHHERWDGSGYMGLEGDQIAYISRLMAVADVFDALTSDRHYKVGWSVEDTYTEIVRLSGTQFDPDVVKIFIDHFQEFKRVLDDNPDKTLVEN